MGSGHFAKIKAVIEEAETIVSCGTTATVISEQS